MEPSCIRNMNEKLERLLELQDFKHNHLYDMTDDELDEIKLLKSELTGILNGHIQRIKDKVDFMNGYAKRGVEITKLKQRLHETDYATLHTGCTVGLPDCLMCKIQKILRGKNEI